MSEKWITAVLGVTPNPERYAFRAVEKLTEHEFPSVALGFRKGTIAGVPILTEWPKEIDNLRVVSMYIGPARQPEFYDYIMGLHPEKVIFNPGTENEELYQLLNQEGILYEEACTLVLLSTGAFAKIV